MNTPAEIARYAGRPRVWLEGWGTHAARIAVVHQRQGRPEMAAEYRVEAAAWFELAAVDEERNT